MRQLIIPAMATTLALPQAAAADPLTDPQLSPLIAAAFAEARAECAERGGMLEMPERLHHEAADLTGNGAPDLIFSEEGAFCAPDLGFIGSGSAGARIHAIIGDHVQSLLPGNWTVTDLQFSIEGEALPPVRVLILAVHGGFCDGFGASPCFVTYGWDGTRLQSVLDGPAPRAVAP